MASRHRTPDDLDHLCFRQAVFTAPFKMGSKLVGTIHRDQGTDRDETAVAFRKSGPFPDVPEQNIIGELGQLGGRNRPSVAGRGMAPD